MASSRSANECAVLTIAGSDPSGGAGIQADLKTFAAHRCYGASVITSLTAQNTTGVYGVHAVPPSFVAQQLELVLDDVAIHGIKTGMLYDKEVCCAVAQVLKKYQDAGNSYPIVCDPVCASTSGHALLQPDAVEALITEVFPLSALITPNKAESELLLQSRGDGMVIDTLDDMLQAATTLATYGSSAVLLKGGHLVSSLAQLDAFVATNAVKVVKQQLLDENMEILQVGAGAPTRDQALVVDLLFQSGALPVLFVRPRIESTSTHGTGCTLSAAIACGLAQGLRLEDAVAEAALYTYFGIVTAQPIGAGFGPLNHLHAVVSKSVVPRRTPVNPYPFTYYLIERTKSAWRGYVEHDFVQKLGRGTLERQNFVHFIKQDYHYLKYYARAYGLLAAKSSTFSEIGSAAQVIMNVIHEIGTHKSFCATFGVTSEELDATPEATPTTAYGAYIMNVGIQGGTAELMMALMACLLGYGEVGLWLQKQSSLPNSWVVLDGNPYQKWIDDYSGEMYQSAVRIGLETLEKLFEEYSPSAAKLEEWTAIWMRCTQLERGFWDMAMNLQQ